MIKLDNISDIAIWTIWEEIYENVNNSSIFKYMIRMHVPMGKYVRNIVVDTVTARIYRFSTGDF